MLDETCWMMDRFTGSKIFNEQTSDIHPTIIQHDKKMLMKSWIRLPVALGNKKASNFF